jgi:hypothetical protein
MQWHVIGALPALLVAALAGATPPPAGLAKDLVATSQALFDAIPAGDKALWQDTLADDAVLVDEFGRIQHKQDVVDSIRKFPPGISGTIELRDPVVRRHGDSAIVQAEIHERETFFGQHFTVRYLTVMTYVEAHGAWKLAASATVTLPTAPPKLEVSGLVLSDYAGTYRYAPGHAWTFSVKDGVLGYVSAPGRAFNALDPVARDVFMGSDAERNLLVFRRDAEGRVTGLIERRKFNDLHLAREVANPRR